MNTAQRKVMASALLCIFIIELGFFSDTLIRAVWYELRLAPATVVWLTNDAAVALDAGKYYFNWYDTDSYDIVRASQFLNTAQRLDPHNPEVWYHLGRIDFLNSNFTRAIAKMDYVIRTDDTFFRAYYVRGLAAGFAGNFENAVADFRTYIEYDEQGWYSYNDIAWLYFKQERWADAERVALEGLTHAPGNPWLLLSLGAARIEMGDFDAARTALERAQSGAAQLTPRAWGSAYPGNDPRITADGLAEFKAAIESNLRLIETAQQEAYID